MVLEKILFRDWRYENDDETKPKADFPLNQSKYKGEILVAGKNLVVVLPGNMLHGHYGLWFRCGVSSFFAEFLRTMHLNNFLLPVTGK